jgi:hypothetical protein
MPKVYILDDGIPLYIIYDVKPEGLHTDEIELTDEELRSIKDSEGALAEAQDLIRAKILEAHAHPKS